MDMFTINQIAIIRQHEYLQSTAQDRGKLRGEIRFRKLLRPVGILLVAAGQRLIDAAQDMTQPAPQLITSETFEVCDPSCS